MVSQFETYKNLFLFALIKMFGSVTFYWKKKSPNLANAKIMFI